MADRLGKAVYWAACIVAFFAAGWAILNFVAAEGPAEFSSFNLTATAIAIYLIGRAVLYALAGR